MIGGTFLCSCADGVEVPARVADIIRFPLDARHRRGALVYPHQCRRSLIDADVRAALQDSVCLRQLVTHVVAAVANQRWRGSCVCWWGCLVLFIDVVAEVVTDTLSVTFMQTPFCHSLQASSRP